jgi:hypothetical protein
MGHGRLTSFVLLGALLWAGCRAAPDDAAPSPPPDEPKAATSAAGAEPGEERGQEQRRVQPAALGKTEGSLTVHGRIGDRGFATPLDAVKSVKAGEGTIDVYASQCGACHTDIYAEWQQTTHAHALQDPQYIAELAKPSSPRWLCLNCHIPNQNQRRHLISGETRMLSTGNDLRRIEERENPDFDPRLRKEAITCATCHVRPGDGGGTVIGPRGDTASPHAVKKDPEALRNICVRCHNPGGDHLTPSFVCWFETAEELAAGPWAGERTCVDCHMPETERPLAAGGPVRKTRMHHWVGGGVPKSYDAYDTLLARGWEPALDVSVLLPAGDAAPEVLLANRRAGHWIPTADPERHYIVRALVERLSDGAVISQDSLRIGQRWDWGDDATGRIARRLEDTRLKPKEERTWVPKIELPKVPAGHRLVIEALHVRLSPDNARFMKKAIVDDELRTLAPGAAEAIAHVESSYPMYSEVFRQEIDLVGGARRSFSYPELIERSKAARTRSLDEHAARLGGR